MDRIDRQIVHCLHRDGRASFRRIGEVIGVSEQTVARRYRNLHADGMLRVLTLQDPRATGAQIWFVRIQCRPGSADRLADAIAARDDVAWVSINSGGGELVCATRSDHATDGGSVLLDRLPQTNQVLSFTACSVLHMHIGGEAESLAFDDPLSAEQVERLLHDSASGRRTGAIGTGVLTAADQPLLAALARDGRAGTVALAAATGWSSSRVSSRLHELFAAGAIGTEVDLASAQFGFASTSYLWLTVAPGELDAVGKALSLHRETAFAAAVTGTANLMTSVLCRDAAALYHYVTTEVGALSAVRQVEIVPVLRRVKQAGTRLRNGRLELGPVRPRPPVVGTGH